MLGLVALLTCALPGTGAADVLMKQGLVQLHQRAATVVRAKVVDVRSAWNPEGTLIFTYARLAVLEHYKGSGPGSLEIRVPGGKVGSYRITADSMPRFEPGTEVLVFLTTWNDGALKVAGYVQGLSLVEPSPGGPRLRGGSLDGRRLGDVERDLRSRRGGHE